MTGTLANFPEGQAAMELLIRSVDRMMKTGRIRSLDPVLVAGQFLAATHGYILLDIAGAFPEPGRGLTVIGQLAVHLTTGLGDSPEMAQQSLLTAVARHGGPPAGSTTDEGTR